MQDGIIDIVNRSYCYEESCEPIAVKYRYCIYSSILHVKMRIF